MNRFALTATIIYQDAFSTGNHDFFFFNKMEINYSKIKNRFDILLK
ncbi:hypothetical protein QW060_21360 [Myroides ceti]|uniref:Uncharacterized protein n=1 Tax=Paenimyroides ceti TaxID=395087 RepID=A0ABT8CZI3_9FLAO|nr:hypothetical protein [Paenimyroides ceti]MDN3706145.1 hypothetical protein [Paenimyroides ceti]MDN3709526.1 hypothetical protein [Paenimyroides ceti]